MKHKLLQYLPELRKNNYSVTANIHHLCEQLYKAAELHNV